MPLKIGIFEALKAASLNNPTPAHVKLILE